VLYSESTASTNSATRITGCRRPHTLPSEPGYAIGFTRR